MLITASYLYRWVDRLRYVGVQRQNSSSITSLPPASSLPSPPEDSPKAYREPLPPIQLTPSSSRAHSPVPGIASLQLPPLDPALYGQSSSYSRHHHHPHHRPHHHHVTHEHILERDADNDNDGKGRERYGSLGDGPTKDFDALSLTNAPAASSARFGSSSILRDDADNVDSRRGNDADQGSGGGQRMDVDT